MARQDRKEADWIPKTSLGKKVLAGEVTSLEEILSSGKKILEPQIIDFLMRGQLKESVMEITSTQRMTACGRKQLMRAVVLVGNEGGLVGAGVGKAVESRDAIAEGILDAKRNLVRVQLGCGSWECGCKKPHSLAQEARGNNGSTQIILKPAPQGVGLVANEVTKKVLELGGVRDAWTFSKGRTRNVLNMILATIRALDSLNHLKKGIDADTSGGEPTAASDAVAPVDSPPVQESEASEGSVNG